MAPTKIDSDQTSDLPTDEEILDTFQALGLLPTSGPTGYAYLSAWGPVAPTQVFNVIRTSNSAPRGA